jgi:hypothetical protein
MRKIFRWIDGENTHEYRFEDDVCLGFFTNDKKMPQSSMYEGKTLDDNWLKNLTQAGFILSPQRIENIN